MVLLWCGFFLVKITPNLFSKTSIVEIEIKNNIAKHYQEKKEFINLKLDATKLTLDWSKALEAYKKSLQNNKLTLINYESKKLMNNLFFNYENKSFAKNTNEIDNDFKLENSKVNYAKNEITLTISANAYVNQDGSNFKNTYKIDYNQLPIDLFSVTFNEKKLSDSMKSKNLIIDKNIIAKFFVDIKHDESVKNDIVFSYKEQILEKSLNEKILKQIEFKVDSFSIDDNSFNLQLLLNGNDKDFVNIFSKTIKMQNATIYLTNNLTFGTKEEQFKSFQKAFGNDLNQRVIVEHFNIHPKYPGWTLKNVLANIIKGCDFKITNKTGLASTSFKPYWAEAINTQQIKWSLNSNQFVLHFRFNNIKKTNKEFYLKKIVFTFEKTNFGELRDMEKNPLKSIEVLDSN